MNEKLHCQDIHSTFVFMNTVLLNTEYFGPVSSYVAKYEADHIFIEHCENYQKKSTRNRTLLLSPNGVITLSIPLTAGKNNKCPISEVEISYDQDWIEEHCQALLSCYGKSPYYEYYIDDITNILWQKNSSLLVLNNLLTNYCKKSLGIDTGLIPTENYKKQITEEGLDLRGLSFEKRKPMMPPAKQYRQVWDDRFDFVPGLSVLDLLFNHGPESGYYL